MKRKVNLVWPNGIVVATREELEGLSAAPVWLNCVNTSGSSGVPQGHTKLILCTDCLGQKNDPVGREAKKHEFN